MKKKPTVSVITSEYGRKRRVKRCLTCGKMYWKPRNMARSKYCSVECYKNRPRKPVLTKKCVICHRVFEKKKGTSLKCWNEERKFCSIGCFTEAKRRGWYTNFKGKKHSLKTRRHLSMVMKKNPPRYWLGKSSPNKGIHGVICRLDMKGPRNWNWKGGVTSKNKLIRRSPKYIQWREEVFKRDGYTCTVCGMKGCRIEAHHKKSFRDYPELRFDVNNGITVCAPCHAKIDMFRKKTYGQQTS